MYPFKLSTLIPEIHVGREKLFAEIDEDIFDVEKLGKLMNKKNSFEIEILGRKKNSKKQEEFLKFFSLIEKILRYEEFAELITKFSKITLKKNDTMKYYNLFLAYNLYKINMNISITLCKIIENVEYITPLRAMSERYYRINSNIRKIDPSGRNLATYISNFSETDMIKLKKWLIENFQFSIDLKESTGHNSIKVIDASNNEGANIIDTGFGYSQILPILINLWEISNKTNKSRQYDKNLKILLIEQPELHLHPAFQAKLTDVIINLVEKTKEKIDFRIIMETHSETIINRICNQIGKGNLNKEDISLLIFEKEKIGTVIKEAEFDDEGYLTNWPYGFFEPEGVK
nr:DUF3696 domain-containing protein [Sebaldella termitidis]